MAQPSGGLVAKKLSAFVLLLFLQSWLIAQAPPAGQPVSPGAKSYGIAIVNIQDAIVATKDGKRELSALQQRFGPRSNQLKARSDALEKDKATLQAQGEKLNELERNRRIKQLSDNQRTLQRDGEDFQAEVQQAEQEVINRIGQKVLNVLAKYATDNGYVLVIDVSNPQTPVLWAKEGANITKELVDAYDAAPPT